jgi:transcriptional regulator with XRE-family HTH domain
MENKEEKNLFFSLFDQAEKDSNYDAEGIKIEIAEQIYEIMEKKHINQTKLAEMLDVTRAYVSKILKGNANLTIETLAKISNGLDAHWEIKLNKKTKKAARKNLMEAYYFEAKQPLTIVETSREKEDAAIKTRVFSYANKNKESETVMG